MSEIRILNMNLAGRYADGSPRYYFHKPFPGAAKTLDKVFDTPEDAYTHGEQYVKDYAAERFPGGMGVCLGVAAYQGGYQAVVNTYYSRS